MQYPVKTTGGGGAGERVTILMLSWLWPGKQKTNVGFDRNMKHIHICINI